MNRNSSHLLYVFSLCLHHQSTALQSTAVEVDKMAALATAADESRGLAMDSIAAAHSGHMGLPLGAAEIGAVLWGSQVSRRKRSLCLSLDRGDLLLCFLFSSLKSTFFSLYIHR